MCIIYIIEASITGRARGCPARFEERNPNFGFSSVASWSINHMLTIVKIYKKNRG